MLLATSSIGSLYIGLLSNSIFASESSITLSSKSAYLTLLTLCGEPPNDSSSEETLETTDIEEGEFCELQLYQLHQLHPKGVPDELINI